MNKKKNQKLIRRPKIKKFEFRFHFNLKKLLIGFLIGFLVFSFIRSVLVTVSPSLPSEEISLSQLLADIKEEKVDKVLIAEEILEIVYKDESQKISRKEPNQNFTEILKDAGIDQEKVNYQVKSELISKFWARAFEVLLYFVLPIAFFLFIFRRARGVQDSIFSFGRSRAKLFVKGKQLVTFDDVGGVEEAKKELEEIVDFLKNPRKYRALGARTPKGVLLIGPSGTGKTLMAKAVAGQAGVPFFSMAGSEFMEMLVGVGSARVRDLFSTAKKAGTSIIFIDELDAIGRMRGLGMAGGGHGEQEQTLNQILTEMDGFTPNDHVIVLAASVVGETPVLIKKNNKVNLIPIGEFIDGYFDDETTEGEKDVKGVYCLGFTKKVSNCNLLKNNLYFEHSAFKKIRSVFRHKVKQIYEIEYIGGKIRATGNHSVFVRSPKGLETKAVANLKKGDIFIDLPYKVNRTHKKRMQIRSHRFDPSWLLELPFFDPKIEQEWQQKYLFAIQNGNGLSQSQIAQQIGVSQHTVSRWQRGLGQPRPISKAYFKHNFPEKIKVTPELCRLLGYYVAEGYARKEVDFCFSIKESEKIEDVISLVKETLGIEPDAMRHITPGAVNIVYHAKPLANFLIRHCGKGARNKHIPSFLFEAPYEYFIEFLRGLFNGDGYEDKQGRGEITSVSKQLIYELNWLCRMHGMKTYINGFVVKEGRRIKNGKPLKATQAYRLGWGKANNPFNKYSMEKTYPVKRAIVKSVKKIPFNGFVYDFCGVENEAFFGGKGPVLLHNTNRPDFLDPALVRPGRFDRRIVLNLPDIEERKKILEIHKKGKPFIKAISWDKVAKRTVGFSGADLENMLNEAAILAAREGKKTIDTDDIEEAATKVKLGPEKKRLQTDEEREMAAYHEAGHAVTAFNLKTMDPVHRISIVSRGLALGFTLIPPERDKYTETKTELEEKVVALLGGRATEEIKFNEFTGGAASDIAEATRIVRRMVMHYGMSDLGPLHLGPQIDKTEWGRAFIKPSELSDTMQTKVDQEIKKIVDIAYERAKEILEKNRKKLDLVVKKLLEKETLEGEEFKELMKN